MPAIPIDADPLEAISSDAELYTCAIDATTDHLGVLWKR
jgi:hypothetical protein